MNNIILEALKLGLWRQLDVQFAHMLVNDAFQQNSLMLAVITLSSYVRRGNVCLPLSALTPGLLFFGSHISLASKACETAGNLSINHWEKLLISSFIVSNGLYLAPLVLDTKRLYLHRMWKNECLVADFFHYTSQESFSISEKKTQQIAELLDYFFPVLDEFGENQYLKEEDKNINWQKVAVAMIFFRKIVVISGGPGTGKTSIISKLLMILALLHDNSKNFSSVVKIGTPTGKSSARLNDSIRSVVKKFNLSSVYRNYCFSVQAITLHRLLGIYFNKENMQCVQSNFFNLDYLILDESSMIDLSMMAKIIMVLPSKTEIIFLGDHQQLSSVEPGSIFSDICCFIAKGSSYTLNFFEHLKSLTNYVLPVNEKNKYNISDSLCLLRRNYRFSSVSGIGKLASAITSGNQYAVLSLLTSNKNNDLNYTTLDNNTNYVDMLISCALGYLEYFKHIIDNTYKNLSFILRIFNRFRILCVLRKGAFGVLQLNSFIENILNYHGFIELKDNHLHYVGRPIMITSNVTSLSLFNGEVGIILPDHNIYYSKLSAYFLSSDGGVKKIALHKLPSHETSFAMTIHKSQGSEFKNIMLIFLNKIIPILSRELLYTGVTRARKYLSIYATDDVINYSVSNPSKRYSGLVNKLKYLQQKNSLK